MLGEGNRGELLGELLDLAVELLQRLGEGDDFCGGSDFSGGLDHYEGIREQGYDPGMDVHWVANQYTSYIPAFMGLWRGAKPTIAKVHGYCVGGGSGGCSPSPGG